MRDGLPESTAALKYCYACETEKPLADFSRDRSRPDGHGSRCGACHRAHNKQWRNNNPGYFQGRHQRPEYVRKWRQDHPGYYAAAVARWREKNPERYLDGRRVSDAKRRSRGGKIENVDHRAIYIRDKGICHLCGRTPSAGSIEFDHVVPLSKGGDHTSANIKVACASCNASKGAKILEVAA